MLNTAYLQNRCLRFCRFFQTVKRKFGVFLVLFIFVLKAVRLEFLNLRLNHYWVHSQVKAAWSNAPPTLRELFVSPACVSEDDLIALSSRCEFDRWPFVDEFAEVFRISDTETAPWLTSIQSLSLEPSALNFEHAARCKNLTSLQLLNFTHLFPAAELLAPQRLVLQDGVPPAIPRRWQSSVRSLSVIGSVTQQERDMLLSAFTNLREEIEFNE